MAPSDKIMNKKALSPVEDDQLSFLANVELGLSSPVVPVSAPKKSKVDTIDGGGESALARVLKSSETPHPPSRGKGKGLLTSEPTTRDTSGDRRSTDRPSSARPSSGRSSQLPSRTMTVKPHLLLPMVTTLLDLIPREHLREVGLDRVDSSGFLHSLLRSLTQVVYEARYGIAASESHRCEQLLRRKTLV